MKNINDIIEVDSKTVFIEMLISDFKLIRSNKLSIHESSVVFLGTIFSMLNRKMLFKRNSDLKEFVNNDLLKYLKKDSPYRDYLFFSRHNLIARIQKDIVLNLNYQDISNLSIFLEELLKSKLPKKNTPTNKRKKQIDPIDIISDWNDFIKNNN